MTTNYFVTAIGTDCGKTIASAILVEALKADYWKPIQAGDMQTDTSTIRNLVDFDIKCHTETYLLHAPMSPDAAAALQNKKLELEHIKCPNTNNNLIIEGAGGLLVPINKTAFIVDLIPQLNCEVILVVAIYLGCINHTLLSINELKSRGIKLKGIIFNGENNQQTKTSILHFSNCIELLHIHTEPQMTKIEIKKYADILLKSWN